MIKVYGASDDLIEIEGDIKEEFSYSEKSYLAFSDGTILSVYYDGEWNIKSAARGSAKVDFNHAQDGLENGYTDVAYVYGDIDWVALVTDFARRR